MVFPEPRKPVTIVMGIGAILTWFLGLAWGVSRVSRVDCGVQNLKGFRSRIGIAVGQMQVGQVGVSINGDITDLIHHCNRKTAVKDD